MRVEGTGGSKAWRRIGGIVLGRVSRSIDNDGPEVGGSFLFSTTGRDLIPSGLFKMERVVVSTVENDSGFEGTFTEGFFFNRTQFRKLQYFGTMMGGGGASQSRPMKRLFNNKEFNGRRRKVLRAQAGRQWKA